MFFEMDVRLTNNTVYHMGAVTGILALCLHLLHFLFSHLSINYYNDRLQHYTTFIYNSWYWQIIKVVSVWQHGFQI